MIIKFIFSQGFINAYADDITVQENPWGGVRSILIEALETFWTGSFHLTGGSNLVFQITNVNEIRTRSNAYESNEEWITVWERKGRSWDYAIDREAAELLEDLVVH